MRREHDHGRPFRRSKCSPPVTFTIAIARSTGANQKMLCSASARPSMRKCLEAERVDLRGVELRKAEREVDARDVAAAELVQQRSPARADGRDGAVGEQVEQPEEEDAEARAQPAERLHAAILTGAPVHDGCAAGAGGGGAPAGRL